MKVLLLIAVLFLSAYSGESRIGNFWVINETKGCDYFIQINEDNQVLTTIEGQVPGRVGNVSIWDIRYENVCLKTECSAGECKTAEDAKRELGMRSFKNLKGQNCFLDPLSFNYNSDGGFFTSYTWFSHVYFKISCEDSSSVPDYCSKSEAYAMRVLLENHRDQCDSIGGAFEGEVYPIELPDGTTEYCVSGKCDACESEWRHNLVEEWKEDVCCDERGKEPSNGNGKCQEPIIPAIGIGYPKITAFPGCSAIPAGQGENNFCDEPPSSSSTESSSSSEEESSSSSQDGSSSSSEDMEDAECYANFTEANAAYDGKIWLCMREGNIPDFKIDKRGCITGECMERSSSSSSSDSGRGSKETGQCAVSMKSLQKSADYYDDWVYIGKESYDSRQVTRYSLKPGTNKFFDALGRVYSKMKAQIKYYVFKDAIDKNEYEITKEFDVWARIIKDSDGNDVQLFVKEDKAHGLRKDSSFYWDGRWEVFEREPSGTVRLRTSDGTVSWSKYDDKKRLTENYLIDENGDTLISERYEWKNERLAKTVIDGVARNYIYGKTLQDTVKVIPSDYWTRDYYNSGYNGTAGKMPAEGTSEYEIFARGPYRYSFPKDTPTSNFAAKNSSGSLNVLQRITDNSGSCVDKVSVMPVPQCVRDEYEDIGNINTLSYGWSDSKPSISFKCECNASGKYQPSFRGNIFYEEIIIKQSTWKYDNKWDYWYEICWYRQDLNKTYNHEAQHIRNARNAINEIIKQSLTFNTYNTEKECDEQARKEQNWLYDRWNEWYKREQEHLNPDSPIYSGRRDGHECD